MLWIVCRKRVCGLDYLNLAHGMAALHWHWFHHSTVLCFLISCTVWHMGTVGQVQTWTKYVIRDESGVPWLMGKADFGQVNWINSKPWAEQEQSRVLWMGSCGWQERQTLGRKRKVMNVCNLLKRIKNPKSTICKYPLSSLQHLAHWKLGTTAEVPRCSNSNSNNTRAMTATLPVIEQEEEVG